MWCLYFKTHLLRYSLQVIFIYFTYNVTVFLEINYRVKDFWRIISFSKKDINILLKSIQSIANRRKDVVFTIISCFNTDHCFPLIFTPSDGLVNLTLQKHVKVQSATVNQKTNKTANKRKRTSKIMVDSTLHRKLNIEKQETHSPSI